MEFRYYTETLYTNESNEIIFKNLKSFKKFAINLAIKLNEDVHYYYYIGTRFERSGTITNKGLSINLRQRDYTI
jgi:hypothetical protein